jgi:hypothetical protein
MVSLTKSIALISNLMFLFVWDPKIFCKKNFNILLFLNSINSDVLLVHFWYTFFDAVLYVININDDIDEYWKPHKNPSTRSAFK